MRTTLSFALSTLLGLAASAAFAADESSKDELERRARSINRAAEKEAVFKKALHHVSIETGVPESRVQEQHRRNPEMGLAGILMANVMAAETKKEPSEFIKQRKGGKGWSAIARANNVSIDKLTLRLDNLDKAIGAPDKKGADDAASEKQRQEKQKQQERDR
jgi:hypothetical protein